MARAAFAKLTIDENESSIGGKLSQLNLGRRTDTDNEKPQNLGTHQRNIQRDTLPSKAEQILEIFKKPLGTVTGLNVRPANVSAQPPVATVRQPLQPAQSFQQPLVSKIPRLRRTTTSASQLTSSEEIEDIDANDDRDAIYQVTEFIKDIYSYLRHLENVQSIGPNFLKHQTVLTPKVRARLVNWCIGAHGKLKLSPETLYLSIAIMDRYFQIEKVDQTQVQLVGITSMFIASKYEEIYMPTIADYVFICGGDYRKRDILKTEISVLKKLNFDLGRPLPLTFLRRFSKAAHSDLKMHTLAKYLMELSLTEYECAHWKPSLMAATALYVAIKLLDKGGWSPTLAHYTCYPEAQLKPYASTMCKTIKKSHKLGYHLHCVKKYSTAAAMEVPSWPELASPMVDQLEQ